MSPASGSVDAPASVSDRAPSVLLIIGGLASVLFVPFFVLTGSTQRQVSDEWLFAAWLRERGLFGAVRYGYTHISGRLLLHLFGGTLSTLPSAVSFTLSVGALVCVAVSIWCAIRAVTKDRGGRGEVVAISWLCVISLVAGSPARNQAVFWPIGALVYLFPAALAAVALAFAVILAKSPESELRNLTTGAGVVCAFFASSGNETQAVIVPILLFLVAYRASGKDSVGNNRNALWRMPTRLVFFWISAGLGGLALILAPGNGQRPKLLERPVLHDPKAIATFMARNFEVLLANVAFNGLAPMVTLTALGFCLGRKTPVARSSWRYAGRSMLAASLLASLVFSFVCAWGFNASAPPRAMFPIWCVFAATSFLVGARLGSRPMKPRQSKKRATVKSSAAGLSPIVAFSSCIAPAAFAFNVAQTLPRDRAVANQVDCIVQAARESGANGGSPVSIASPLEVDHVIILENKPSNDSNSSIAKRFGSGPITRVRPGENGACDREARRLVPFTRAEEFG